MSFLALLRWIFNRRPPIPEPYREEELRSFLVWEPVPHGAVGRAGQEGVSRTDGSIVRACTWTADRPSRRLGWIYRWEDAGRVGMVFVPDPET